MTLSKPQDATARRRRWWIRRISFATSLVGTSFAYLLTGRMEILIAVPVSGLVLLIIIPAILELEREGRITRGASLILQYVILAAFAAAAIAIGMRYH
jgi:hypothetical protein